MRTPMKPVALVSGLLLPSPDVVKVPAPPGGPVPVPYPDLVPVSDIFK